jgi:two-component system CheB/CheR fusion protein
LVENKLKSQLVDWSVLIIDDRDDNRESLAQFLELYGIKAHVAVSGSQALRMLSDLHPTFILTDINMPGMDGWQILHAIRTNPHTANLPVIAITGSVEIRDTALQSGFDGFVGKPVSIETIVSDLFNMVSPTLTA